MPQGFADTPEPPYYAVIFTSQRTNGDEDGYERMASTMLELALRQSGCLGAESVRDRDGMGITVGYFKDDADIRAWKENVRHLAAQRLGQERWYQHYELRVARVERAYAGPRQPGSREKSLTDR